MRVRPWCLALALAVPLGGTAPAARAANLPAKEPMTFGALRAPTVEAARAQALAWLTSAGKADAATQKKFDTIWNADEPLLDRVAATLALGNAPAARLLADARNAAVPAPTRVPLLLKDAKQPAFFRANLALAYARTLSGRKVYEEALDALKAVQPQQTVDPAAYYFHRAVAEHALMLKTEGLKTITGLLEDVADAPDRYKMVGLLMYQDMLTWQDKGLGQIARLMDNSERRLELARGGPKTQKIQKTIVARLDEIIKKLETPSDSNGGS